MTAPIQTGFPGTPTSSLSVRQRCEVLRGQLELARDGRRLVWQDCNDFILPYRARFQPTDMNRGDRRNLKIIDATATLAMRVFVSGMASYLTSPASEWFDLGTANRSLMQQKDVELWLAETAEDIRATLLQSNFYNTIATLYGDIGAFGTGAMLMEEDDADVVRFYDQPVGSYAVGLDARRNVRVFSRVFQLTIQQIVEKWGQINPVTGKANFEDGRPTTISVATQQLYLRGGRMQYGQVVHIVQPNLSYDGAKIDPRYKKYESIYYEMLVGGLPFLGTVSDLLQHTGYDEFPVIVGRWDTSGDDAYATNWPGLVALGDIKQLQTMTKRGGQATEKFVNPPMTGPAGLRSAAASIIPGNITYFDTPQGAEGFRPVHQLPSLGPAIQALREDKIEVQARIKDAFLVNMFMMLDQLGKGDYTATEIMERKDEALRIAGPVVERTSEDVLGQVIARTFQALMRRGLIQQPPDALQGQRIIPEYISVMARAQKQTGLAGIERFAGFVAQSAQFDPSVLDGVDGDEMIQQYAERSAIPPSIVRGDAQIHQIRAERQKQQAAQQAAQNAPALAGAAKDLSQTPVGNTNALATLTARAAARRTLAATPA